MGWTWRNEIQCEGLDAYMNGVPVTVNPYSEKTKFAKFLQWKLGWCKAHAEAEDAVKESARWNQK